MESPEGMPVLVLLIFFSGEVYHYNFKVFICDQKLMHIHNIYMYIYIYCKFQFFSPLKLAIFDLTAF